MLPLICLEIWFYRQNTFRFLKHLERTKIYLHIIDAACERSPEEDYQIIRGELEAFNPELLKKREIIVFNNKKFPPIE